MVGEDFSQEKEKLKDIVLQHLKRILELSTQEFAGGYEKEVLIDNRLSTVYVPDSRKQYIQSVESLSDVLLPFFDNEIKKPSDEINKRLEELDKKMKEKEEGLIKKGMDLNDRDVRYHNKNKLKICRELFRELNLLLERGNLL